MHTFKSLVLGALATVMLAATPAGHAQTPDELRTMQAFLQIVTDYFDVIRSTHDIASDPEKSAILQLQKIQEVYEGRGEKARSVPVLENVLAESRNPAIRNAAYMMLGDTLKETGRTDDALRFLQQGLRENLAAAQ